MTQVVEYQTDPRQSSIMSREDSGIDDATMLALRKYNSLDSSNVAKRKEIAQPYRRTRKQLQLGMFLLCYFSYGSIHVYREFWSLSKTKIEADPSKYHCDKETLSNVDTVNFMVYGLAQFVTGAMGDAFPLRIVLPISYFL